MARIEDLTDLGPPTVAGRIEFRDLAATAPRPSEATIEFRDIHTRAVIRSVSATLDANGRFSIDSPQETGPYALSVKHTHWLRRSIDIDTGNGNVSGVLVRLTNGDVDEDDEVGIGDYALLSASFGSAPGDPNWFENADLNGDDEVDIADYAVLSSSFGLQGEP